MPLPDWYQKFDSDNKAWLAQYGQAWGAQAIEIAGAAGIASMDYQAPFLSLRLIFTHDGYEQDVRCILDLTKDMDVSERQLRNMRPHAIYLIETYVKTGVWESWKPTA